MDVQTYLQEIMIDFATVDDGSCIPSVQIDLLEVCNPYCENDFGSVTFELNGGVPPYSFNKFQY